MTERAFGPSPFEDPSQPGLRRPHTAEGVPARLVARRGCGSLSLRSTGRDTDSTPDDFRRTARRGRQRNRGFPRRSAPKRRVRTPCRSSLPRGPYFPAAALSNAVRSGGLGRACARNQAADVTVDRSPGVRCAECGGHGSVSMMKARLPRRHRRGAAGGRLLLP
jgi:hypothetical protein